MRLVLFLISVMFFAFNLLGQNIIANGDLEDTIPKNFGLKFAKQWNSPSDGSPDYLTNFHTVDFGSPDNFAGYQSARSGIAYLGIITFFSNGLAREYVQNELIRALVKDSIYCFQMYVSIADSMNFATKNSLGLYFSETSIKSTTRVNLPFTPYLEVDSNFIIDKINWVKVGGKFTANGNEKYLIIGNFNDNSNTDTLNVHGGGYDPMFQAAYYYIDDVFLGHCDSLPEDTAIGLVEQRNTLEEARVYPNPTQGIINLEVSESNQYEVKLYDYAGRVRFEGDFSGRKTQFDISELNPGIYYIHILSDKRNYYQKVVIKR